MDDIEWMPARELREHYAARRLSPLEVARHLLDRIGRLDPKLGAFLTLDPEAVLRQARRAEQALYQNAPLAPLHGIPVSLKDSIPTGDLRTTWGSLLYRDFVAAHDAVVVARLRGAGAIILGKTNVPEFQVTGRTRNRLMQECKTPWDITRSAGGSSGGCAASVAAGFNPVSIGGDEGGSIRLPAAYNGQVGICPSQGRVPHIALGPEGGFCGHVFQHIGPMARDVRDAALTLKLIAGAHPSDPYALPTPPADWLGDIEAGVKGLRVGLVHFPGAKTWPAVAERTQAVARELEKLGARVQDTGEQIEPPLEAMGVLTSAYLADTLEKIARNPVQRQAVTPWLEEFIAAGRPRADAEAQAWRTRQAWIARMDEKFDHYDVLLTPTTGRPAPVTEDNWDLPHATMEYCAATILVNIAGLTAASVPSGFVDGLPVGAQFIARRGNESMLFRFARAVELALPWAQHRPAL